MLVLLLQRIRVCFPVSTGWLTTFCSSSSWGSTALFWAPQALHPHGAYTYMQVKHTHKIQNLNKISIGPLLELGDLVSFLLAILFVWWQCCAWMLLCEYGSQMTTTTPLNLGFKHCMQTSRPKSLQGFSCLLFPSQ